MLPALPAVPLVLAGVLTVLMLLPELAQQADAAMPTAGSSAHRSSCASWSSGSRCIVLSWEMNGFGENRYGHSLLAVPAQRTGELRLEAVPLQQSAATLSALSSAHRSRALPVVSSTMALLVCSWISVKAAPSGRKSGDSRHEEWKFRSGAEIIVSVASVAINDCSPVNHAASCVG
ncbi:hypothetical protein [Amycolatopsis keratiniphila]|uniref:hypothetical protein n=1 Tax=Amycolatopsis keratiniphila TaxID=129921 RepID=UPI00130182C9|nr:hypothetical protein [Amycolatopsis keratiniphila]